MFRLAYRNFGSPSAPNESIVGNFSVNSSGVAGLRWFELKNVTSGPVTVAQESTYQPDTTWRWLGSAAMDHAGNFAIGFSASSSAIHPQIRYAGRLATDPPNTLAQGEAHLFDGTGSSSSGAWDDYSALTVDPVDDCTFWYTNEYYDAINWRTRIGNFKFAQCDGSATPTPNTNTDGYRYSDVYHDANPNSDGNRNADTKLDAKPKSNSGGAGAQSVNSYASRNRR